MAEGRIEKASKNILFNILNQIINLVLSFLLRTIFINTLGAEYLGINGLFADILQMLSMADLGLGTSMVFSFYKPLAENDHAKIASLISFYKKLYRIIAISVSIIGASLIPFLRYIINVKNDIPELEIYYTISLAGVVVSYLYVYKTSILNADQKNYIVTKVTILVGFIKTFFQGVALLVFGNYIIYLIINLICNLLCNLITSIKAGKEYPYIKKGEILNKAEKMSIVRNMKSVFIYKLSSVLLNATDNILISMIVGVTAVGIYSNYMLITNKLIVLFSLFFTSITASIGNLIATESYNKRYEIFTITQSVGFVFSCIIVPCYSSLVNNFIQIWLGEEYLLSNATVIAISLNTYLSCVFQPLWSYREATGMYQKTKWVMFTTAIINIVLSCVLGSIWGVFGIIFASALSRISTYIWIEPRLLFSIYFNMKATQYYKSIIINFIYVSIISVSAMFLSNIFWAKNIEYLVLKGCIFAMVSCVLCSLFYHKSEGIYLLKMKIKNLVKSK